MKTLKIFLCILLLFVVLPSCGDDEPNSGPEFESYISGTFTPSSEAKKLTATYNGTPVTAKEAKISLSSSDNTSGDFVIMNIVDSNKNLKVNKVPLKFNNEKMQPGISQGIEGFSGLYVHGGEDDQNLMIYDGMPLYQVSHLGGLFSSFNVDAVRDVDFYKTSFPAQYGGRISSITDISMREPNKQKFTGSLSLGLISGKAYLTGSIKTNQTAFSLALRRTWIDAISAPTLAIMNAIDKKNGKKTIAGYAFTDVNFKLSHIFNDHINASLIAYQISNFSNSKSRRP